MFGSDAGVVESGGDRVGVDDIAVGRLEEQGLRAVEDAEAPAVDRRGVFARRKTLPARLHADELHLRVVEEPGEEADRVRAAAHAGEGLVGEAPELREALATRLPADHALEIAHHVRIRIRARARADHVERVVAVRHPVAQGLVHRVLERRRTLRDRVDGRAEHLHALHVRCLAFHVESAHVDLARHAEQRGDGRRGDAVHARARFGDEALLAHPLREQRLADRVVHLVRARVVEVLALEDNGRAAQVVREAAAHRDRRFASHVVVQEGVEFTLEGGILLCVLVGPREFMERPHEGFRHVLPPVGTEMSLRFHVSSFQIIATTKALTPMIDALARPTATLRSKLLRRIPASQATSCFAEVRHGQSQLWTVKYEWNDL